MQSGAEVLTELKAQRRAFESGPVAPTAAAGRTHQLDRGAAVHRHERGKGPGLVLRRHRRGDPQRAVAAQGPQGGGARIGVFVSRQGRRPRDHWREAERDDGARRQRAPRRRSGPHHGAAQSRQGRLPDVVGALRPRDQGHLRRPGRDREGDRRAAPDHAGRRQRRCGSCRRRPPTSRRISST